MIKKTIKFLGIVMVAIGLSFVSLKIFINAFSGLNTYLQAFPEYVMTTAYVLIVIGAVLIYIYEINKEK